MVSLWHVVLLVPDSRETSQYTRCIRVTRLLLNVRSPHTDRVWWGSDDFNTYIRHLNAPKYILCGAKEVMIVGVFSNTERVPYQC